MGIAEDSMHRPPIAIFVLCAGLVSGSRLTAGDSVPSVEAIRSAIKRSIPLIEKGAKGSAEQHKCFTCHNQAVPVLALFEAQKRGFAIDESNLRRQVRHTAEHLARGRKDYLEGRGQGGKAIAAGYALWTLEAAGWKADDTTAAVNHFLLEHQKDKIHWEHRGKRPPSSGSDFTTSFVALRGLGAFGTQEQRPQIKARNEAVREWLCHENPRDTEDRVFRLLALRRVDADDKVIRKAADDLLASQQKDGGWAQTAGRGSDAYATGTALFALLTAGKISKDAEAVRRSERYLIDTQTEDGSWHVVTRAEPFQPYYESGFPHGKDQFISIAGSSWATLGLCLCLPEPH
jgi:N-acyl-D-amino-acid deacylase